MSTDYELFKDEKHELSLMEGSSRFSILVKEEDEVRHAPEGVCLIDFPERKGGLSAEEVIDIAVKMMQPTLYNVEDPQKFFKDVILKKVNELHV